MKMNVLLKRALLFCLCMALLPLNALAFSDGTPVTRSDFSLTFRLNADGCPDDGLAHYQDWEDFLQRLSLRGQMDSQSYPDPIDRVYFNGGLYVDESEAIPFEYDAYGHFRYVRTPAFGGASVHFNMFNFFQFMLKPYNYMYIPSQYAALILYPEAAIDVWRKYAQPLKETVQGVQTVSHEELYALCEQLNNLVLEDDGEKIYYFVTSLLIDQGFDWTAMEKLACWDSLLAFLDPDMQGMTIVSAENRTAWSFGDTTVFEKTVSQQETVWTVFLPDPDGYEVNVELVQSGAAYELSILILLDGEEYMNLSAGVSDWPAEGKTSAQGEAWLEVTGDGLYQEIAPIRLAYSYSRTANELPYDMKLSVDLLNNETQKPTLGFTYQAAAEQMPDTVLVERSYDDQEDFFHLNESFIEEYKQRFAKTIVLAAAPVALAVPSGVISDVIAYMEETGILAFIGIE